MIQRKAKTAQNRTKNNKERKTKILKKKNCFDFIQKKTKKLRYNHMKKRANCVHLGLFLTSVQLEFVQNYPVMISLYEVK